MSEARGRTEPLCLVTPDASPEEIAALVAVLSVIGTGQEEPAPAPRPPWQAPHRKLRRSPARGPAGWRASGLPG